MGISKTIKMSVQRQCIFDKEKKMSLICDERLAGSTHAIINKNKKVSDGIYKSFFQYFM